MMRLKIFALFAAIQILSFGIWSSLNEAVAAPVQAAGHAHVHPAPTSFSASIIEGSEVLSGLSFEARNMSENRTYLNSIKQNQIETVLKNLPAEHVASVRNIILDYDEAAHRGLGGNGMVILRAVNMDTQEFIGVLIHELAHNVDYAFLSAEDRSSRSVFMDGSLPIYTSDPSLDFYSISWESNAKRIKTANNMDFVSGYAMSDPFEDFAESYAFYVFHNRDFKVLASTNEALYAKYVFMKNVVFEGQEFDTGDLQAESLNRPWDITVLSYDLSQFLS